MIKKLILAGMVIVIVAIIAGFFTLTRILFPYGHELDITIKNKTGYQTTELYLTYRGLDEDILIDSIDISENYHTRISATENMGESSLTLYYYDNSDVIHEHTVIGYFEGRGGGQSSIVTIHSVDDEGILDISVDVIRP